MWLFWIFCFYSLKFVICDENLPEINKCCPVNQKLDVNLKCVPMEDNEEAAEEKSFLESDGDGELFPWFPLSSIVNSTTLKIHEHHRDAYIELLSSSFKVTYGKMPNCTSEQTEQISYFKTDFIEYYHYILYENNTFRIHISKPGSLHDPQKDFRHFGIIYGDSEVTLPVSSAGNLF